MYSQFIACYYEFWISVFSEETAEVIHSSLLQAILQKEALLLYVKKKLIKSIRMFHIDHY